MAKFRLGQVVEVEKYISGIESGVHATVIEPVPWRSVPGMYCQPDLKRETCLRRIDNGKIFYMFNNRLTIVK